MKKSDIKIDDVIYLRDGRKIIINAVQFWILRDYYDENLCCISGSDFDIVRVERPYYEVLYEEEKRKVK